MRVLERERDTPAELRTRPGHGIEVNVWIPLEPTGYEVDFLWREQALIVETDGRDVHTTRRAFEQDRRRDQRLMLAGYRVVRFPRRQVFEDPACVRDIRMGLRAAGL